MMKIEWTKESLIKQMRREVASMNKQWSKDVIDSFSVSELMARCHPLYRDEYEQVLGNLMAPLK
jgi:hypothetical protein